MSETPLQGNEAPSSPATVAPSLKFQLPETEELDVFVVVLEDGRKVVRTAEELEASEHSDSSLP
jgi:hypothetical protein